MDFVIASYFSFMKELEANVEWRILFAEDVAQIGTNAIQILEIGKFQPMNTFMLKRCIEGASAYSSKEMCPSFVLISWDHKKKDQNRQKIKSPR